MSGLSVKDTAAPGVHLICDGDTVIATVHRGGRELAFMMAAAPELDGALRALMPERVCLTNRNIRDNMVLPCDVEVGALRRSAAALAKARGEA